MEKHELTIVVLKCGINKCFLKNHESCEIDKLNAAFLLQSVTVVWASTTLEKIGYDDTFANVLKGRYTGTRYPINSDARSILSVSIYPSINQIPDDIDLTMIILILSSTALHGNPINAIY